jgi:hypothetical protein
MKAIKAKELEKKFDAGEDISKYLDLSKARRPKQVGSLLTILKIKEGGIYDNYFERQG